MKLYIAKASSFLLLTEEQTQDSIAVLDLDDELGRNMLNTQQSYFNLLAFINGKLNESENVDQETAE